MPTDSDSLYSEDPDVCPECGCEKIVDVETDDRDELVCYDCGLVVSATTTCAFSSRALFGDGNRQESRVDPPDFDPGDNE